MKRFAALVLVLTACLAGTAGERFHAAGLAKRIAPWVDDQTFVVMHVNTTKLAQINIGDVVGQLEQLSIAPPEAARHVREFLEQTVRNVQKAKVRSVYALFSFSHLNDPPLLVIPLGDGVDKDAVVEILQQFPGLVAEARDGVVLAGMAARVKEAQAGKADTAELEAAFTAAGDVLYQAVVRAPTPLRRALSETMPQLPKEFGEAPWSVIDKGVTWIAQGVDVTPKIRTRIVIQSQDAGSAKALLDIIGKGFDYVRARPEMAWIGEHSAKFRDMLMPKVEKDRLVLTLAQEDIAPLVAPLAARARREAARAQGVNNLRQLAIAMHNYHDTYKSFPASASYDNKGKKLLSWRVHLLPFIEQQELYREFKLDEPWDSEHNKKLIAKMPDIYKTPNQKKAAEGKTRYLVPFGKDMIFEGEKGTGIRDITDGTSNTIMIVEAAPESAVIWTKPDDLEVDMKNPIKGLVEAKAEGFYSAFADGSARLISANIAAQTLWALFTRNGAEVIPCF